MTGAADKQLLRVLADVEAAVISGNYDRLAEFAEAMAQQHTRISRQKMTSAQLQPLRHHLSRNAALLQAAREGFEDARRNLANLHSQSATSFYDQTGARHPLHASATCLEHKA